MIFEKGTKHLQSSNNKKITTVSKLLNFFPAILRLVLPCCKLFFGAGRLMGKASKWKASKWLIQPNISLTNGKFLIV